MDTAGNTWYQRSDKIINIDRVWPSIPTYSSPAASHLTWNNRPTFKWNASSVTWCATTITYDLQTCTSSSNSTCSDKWTNLSVTQYTLLANQALADWTRYWRIRSKDNLWNTQGYRSVRAIIIDTQGPNCVVQAWPTPTTLYYGQTWLITIRCTDTNYNTSATVTTSALSYTTNSVLQTLSVSSSWVTNWMDYTFVYKQIWSGSTNISFNSNVFTDRAWNYNGWASASTAVTAVNGMDCPAGWNNDYFLTGRFWHLYYDFMPTQGTASEYKRKLLLCALYGAWPDDTTAYTQYWNGRQWWNTSNGCNVMNMSVSTTNTLPNTLTAHTVYVVTNQNITRSAWIQMANCSAIVNGWQCGAHGSAETYWIRVVSLWSSAALRREPAPKLDGRSLWPAVFGQRASRSAGAASLVLFFACRRSSESQHSFKMFASGPCAPPFQISTACSPEADSPSGPSTGEHFQIRWVPENLFRGCTPSSDMLYSISMEWKLLVWRKRPIFRHALLNSDGVKSTCLVGTPHPQTCSAKFRWSEIRF